jgi:lactate dehydrogenase-like 2-hydroxyacid dehydrogenase
MRGFISKKLLDLANKDSILVSISHPDLIDQKYLRKIQSKFKGIGFDYFITDDVKKLRKLRTKNTIITPHLGSQSTRAYQNMIGTILEAAMDFSKGKPIKFVNS